MGVFSAQAEVFPSTHHLSPAKKRFLRASGGVSESADPLRGVPQFSPRKRRCFYVDTVRSM